MISNAVLFAGQGAQFVGMGKDLADAVPACRTLFERANAVLGFDLARLCFEGPIETHVGFGEGKPGAVGSPGSPRRPPFCAMAESSARDRASSGIVPGKAR